MHPLSPPGEAHLRGAIADMQAEISRLIMTGYAKSPRTAWLRDQVAVLTKMVG